MCGIAGFVAGGLLRQPPPLETMSAAIAHRGPDDAGEWRDERVALVHRRLSIIDTSSGGHQPMMSHCGRYVMVYNGEIYNYLELRRELEQQGVVFRSQSDSEVLLAAFVAYGEDFLPRLNGMWALAIWDRGAARLFISRDRFGEKPFYYAVRDGDLIFASEIKALLATGRIDRTPNPRAVADFCAERVSDHTEQTFFGGINQLPPGSMGWWRDGRLELRRYWRMPDDCAPPPSSNVFEEIAALLEDSVKLRLRADTRVGTLLSGGLDSSAVTCLAAAQSTGRVAAFSTTSEPPPEEAAGIDLVAAAHGNVFVYRDLARPECLQREFDECIWHQEEPFADGSMLAHYRLMRLARETGVRVLLTGQAADEVFAGYPGHLAIHLGGMIGRGRWREAAAFRRALRASGQSLDLTSVGGYALPARVASCARKRRVSASVDWLAEGYDEVSDDVARGYAGRGGDPLNDALRVSLAQRTLPGFLHYEDRNSMAFGVETRIPFLDHRLVEKVLPLPASLKLAGSRTKSLLRRAISARVPPPIVGRLAKQGYPVPISRWLRLQGGALWTDRVALIAACPMIDFARWRRRFERFQSGDEGELPAVWRGLVLASWHDRFIAGSA